MHGALGMTRESLTSRFDYVAVPAQGRRVADGLRKLIMDRCDFETHAGGPG